MGQRIRYSKVDENGVCVSMKQYVEPKDGARLRVHLDTKNLNFSIYDELAEMVAASGEAKSLHKLKIAAKKALENFGITFDAETRAVNTSVDSVVEQAEKVH